MSEYTLDNSWQMAKRRLSLLEEYLDPMTRRRLTKLGVSHGLRCLEVGAGSGSIASWLSEQVGPTGRVVATDIDIRFLKNMNYANLEVVTHDIRIDSLPEGAFDFVHVRWLLHHLAEPELVIRRLISAMRPGSWLLIEDVDFFPVHASISQVYIDFMVALSRCVVSSSGRDCFWARALPSLLAGTGLQEVGGEGDVAIVQGGSAIAEFFALTAEQMRGRIIESGDLNAERFDEALELLKSPEFWAFGGGGVAVWGRRPAVQTASTNHEIAEPGGTAFDPTGRAAMERQAALATAGVGDDEASVALDDHRNGSSCKSQTWDPYWWNRQG